MKLNLDLSGVSTQSSRVVVPTGNYPVEVVNAEAKETKAGGAMLVVGYRILSGQHAGSVISDNYNIMNANEDAQRIALSCIKTILTVGGHKNPDALKDSDEMLGLQLNVYVEEDENNWTNDSGEEINSTQNNFKGFYELDLAEGNEVEAVPVKKKTKVKAEVKKESPFAKTSTEEKVNAAPTEDVAPAKEEKKDFPWLQK